MTAIIYKKGNLLTANEPVFGHACNARGTMGRGIAKMIQDRYPGCYEVYRDKFEREGLKLGDVIPWIGEHVVILNFITQETYGKPGQRYTDYDAVRQCMRRLQKAAARHQAAGEGTFHRFDRIALPRIGAGRGGGDWDLIAEIIEAEVSAIGVTVYTFSE